MMSRQWFNIGFHSIFLLLVGSDCSVNINECDGNNVCGDEGSCEDRRGDYICVCNETFKWVRGNGCVCKYRKLQCTITVQILLNRMKKQIC